jgi:hypothetical protein
VLFAVLFVTTLRGFAASRGRSLTEDHVDSGGCLI